MVFAVEEINHLTTLLPGVKLGYHIHNSCGLPLWALQSALSMVGGDSATCNLIAPQDYSAGYGEESRDRKGNFTCSLMFTDMKFFPFE